MHTWRIPAPNCCGFQGADAPEHLTALFPLPVPHCTEGTGHKFADYVRLGRLAPLMAFMTLAAASDGVLHPQLLIGDACLFMLYVLLNKSEPRVTDCQY